MQIFHRLPKNRNREPGFLHPSSSWVLKESEGTPRESALTEQQELDLAGGSLAISAEVLVDLLGPLGRLLLAGGAHGAAHPCALAGDGSALSRLVTTTMTLMTTIVFYMIIHGRPEPSTDLSRTPIQRHHARCIPHHRTVQATAVTSSSSTAASSSSS